METEFKNRMYNYEVAPPAELWSAIDSALNQPAKVIKLHPKKARSTTFFYSLAAASVALFILANIFFWIQSPEKKNTQLALNRDTASATENVIAHTESSNVTAPKSYVTIKNSEGKKVKVSKKVAAIITSSEKSEKKVVFDKKVEEWKTIMLNTNTTSIFDLLDATKETSEK